MEEREGHLIRRIYENKEREKEHVYVCRVYVVKGKKDFCIVCL